MWKCIVKPIGPDAGGTSPESMSAGVMDVIGTGAGVRLGVEGVPGAAVAGPVATGGIYAADVVPYGLCAVAAGAGVLLGAGVLGAVAFGAGVVPYP
jgi:hypothetical protein